MATQFSALDLAVTRIPAVDGNSDPDRIARALDPIAFRRNMGRAAMPAEVGCYLSHLTVWQRFLETGKRFCLVLEDDVVFHSDFSSALATAVNNADHWDMLKLNRIRAKLPRTLHRVGPYSLNAYLGPATGFGAYLITNDLAARLLPRLLPVQMPIDYEATRFWVYDFRLLGLEPWPSHVDDGGVSTITGRSFENVQKDPRLKRLHNFRMRLANYVHRASWMMKHKPQKTPDR